MKKITIFLFLVVYLTVGMIPAVSAAGVNQGWIQIFCNVQGALVFFDDTYQSLISDGQLLLPSTWLCLCTHSG